MKIVSVNIGEKKALKWNGKIYYSGIYKYPVDKPIFLDFEDVKNDRVIDRRYHGGFEKAVYAYGENHYDYWQSVYPHINFHYGIFGENLTVQELWEEEILVGSIYRLGKALIQVTKPRQPCVKLNIRFNDDQMVKRFWKTSKSGVYFKVIEPGEVAKDDTFELIEKPSNAPSIAAVFEQKKNR